MIGSPASRGAVASTGAARGCFAETSAVSIVKAVVAASMAMTVGFQRRVATVHCAVTDRSVMPSPGSVPVRAATIQTAHLFPGDDRHVSIAHLSYTTARAAGRVACG